MRILLFSMPDSSEHMPSVAIRMPCGALTSLAGNLDGHHQVAVADLVLVQDRVTETVLRLLSEHAPELVGLSVMTFQRPSARKLIAMVRERCPAARIVVGGYDPSLAPEAYAGLADFVVRGEGELTFRELVRALEGGGGLSDIAGLSVCERGGLSHNRERPVSRLEGGAIRLPKRSARVLSGYTLLGRQVDVIETSRGCTYDCSFCSIIEMRGRNFHRYSFERVLQDVRDARDHGARALFLVDDNVTLDLPRFEALCRALIDARLHRLTYLVQAMTSSIAAGGAPLAALMRRAGFRYVFLGIENVLEEDLGFLRAKAKNRLRGGERGAGNASLDAVGHLHRQGIYVVGGMIVGNPGDTAQAIEQNLEFARRYVDWPYIQHPTPYPRTPMTLDLERRGLIVNRRLEEYDGTTAVLRGEHVQASDVEFLRWRAERWIKLRHLPRAFFLSPLFVLRNGRRMMRHTFRGCSLRSLLGLEDERLAFERYRTIRSAERQYL